MLGSSQGLCRKIVYSLSSIIFFFEVLLLIFWVFLILVSLLFECPSSKVHPIELSLKITLNSHGSSGKGALPGSNWAEKAKIINFLMQCCQIFISKSYLISNILGGGCLKSAYLTLFLKFFIFLELFGNIIVTWCQNLSCNLFRIYKNYSHRVLKNSILLRFFPKFPSHL